ncbi:MAG: MGDG synthase family glycosyltransferase [Planctomycetota bacterium]|jgi:processive 1,2-diacylglycerol beta-glucosyltransferase
MKRRVLIVSVSAGAGHLRAAQAVEEALRLRHPRVEILNIDALDYVPAAFRRLYSKGYLRLVNHAPALWNYIYERAERAKPTALSARLNRLVERLNSRRLVKAAAEFAPDEILAVHPLPMDVFNRLKRLGRLKARVSVAVTDFDVHPLWIDPATDRYFAGCEEVAHRLSLRGVKPRAVTVTGIPVVPQFAGPISAKDRHRVCAELGLRAGRPAVLASAGGFGVGDVTPAVKVMAEAAARAGGADLVVVSGRNDKLRRKVAALKAPRGVRLVALGFVTNMHEITAVVDLMISKPGGLTSSECLARRLPMLIVDPIPGQEERNATYLLEAGAAWQASTLDSLSFKLGRLLGDPGKLAAMRRAAGRLARPRACFDVAAALAGR